MRDEAQETDAGIQIEIGAEPTRTGRRQAATVVVVEESGEVWPRIARVCEYLGLRVKRVVSERALAASFEAAHVVAVVSETDMGDQDGFNVMRIAAAHDRHLPFLLILGENAGLLLGAADAAEEAWGMTRFRARRALPASGELVEFLAGAAALAGLGEEDLPRRRSGVRPRTQQLRRTDSQFLCAYAS